MVRSHAQRQLTGLATVASQRAAQASSHAVASTSSVASGSRTFVTSHISRASSDRQDDGEFGGFATEKDARRSRIEEMGRSLPPFDEWKEGVGRELFEKAGGKGPYWLSRTPFPLNPSFCPVAPVSKKVRDELWKLHNQNTRKNSVRHLSSRFGLTVERVQAVLRLRALEQEMKDQSIPLQTEFQREMERLLGSVQDLAKEGRPVRIFDPKAVPETEQSLASGATRGRLVDLEDAESAGDEVPALTKALDAARLSNKVRNSSIKTGGPDPDAIKVTSTIRRKGPTHLRRSAVAERAGIKVLDLSPKGAGAQGRGGGKRAWESYAGAGTLAQNQKRADRRKRSKARRSIGTQEGAAPAS
ncbi:unnamed protein product [Parajaminaea phylloscopi]